MKPGNLLKGEGVQLLVLVLPFLILIPLWDKFPQVVPIHWGIDGKPNGWADKSWGLLFNPLLNVGLAILLGVLPRFDSRLRQNGPEAQVGMRRVLKIIRLVITGFLAAMAVLIDCISLGWKIDVVLMSNLGVLAVLAICGNYLPKLRPNRFVGIRTPWTLKSPEVWMRTHRLFGRIALIGSLALMPLCLLVPALLFLVLLAAFLLLTSVGAMIYSYICYRRLLPRC